MQNFELVHALTDERMLSQDEMTFLPDDQLDDLELHGFSFFEPDIEMGTDDYVLFQGATPTREREEER